MWVGLRLLCSEPGLGMACVRVCLLLALTTAVCLASKYDLNACTYTNDAGKVYDLSPLIPKNESGYQWNQTLHDTAGNLLSNFDFADPVKKILQVHVCRNITKAMNSNCSSKGLAPMYMYDVATKECNAYGSVMTANIQPNPYGDGVFIDYYGGEAESHIVQYEARLYFVCKTGTKLEGPVLEHLKDSYVAHLHFFTEYVC